MENKDCVKNLKKLSKMLFEQHHYILDVLLYDYRRKHITFIIAF